MAGAIGQNQPIGNTPQVDSVFGIKTGGKVFNFNPDAVRTNQSNVNQMPKPEMTMADKEALNNEMVTSNRKRDQKLESKTQDKITNAVKDPYLIAVQQQMQAKQAQDTISSIPVQQTQMPSQGAAKSKKKQKESDSESESGDEEKGS